MFWFTFYSRALVAAAAVAATATVTATADELILLKDGDTAAWEYQTFSGIPETVYRSVSAATVAATVTAPVTILAANSHAAASGFTREQTLPLYDTPWLHFRWRVLQASDNPAEQEKHGDDFAWRLYFVGKSGLEYRVLNLVYAQRAAAGTRWKSPYAGFLRNIQVYALASAAATPPAADSPWHTSVINVGELWREHFGDDGSIGLVGLMTDSDNTGTAARAEYGEIRLSSQP